MGDEKIYNQLSKRVLMKDKLTFNYYYAYWDNAEKEKYAVKDFCYENRFTFNAIDCETNEGINESINNNVKLLPQIVVFNGKKEIFRVKGKNLLNKIREELDNRSNGVQ